eukprot:jgi/Botrbrau1/5632/Bobra.55_1s0021.1
MASLLTVDVMNLLTNNAVRPIVRKKAALCLLRLLRKSPPESDIMAPDVWSVKLATLLEERQPGVLLSVVTLLLGIVSRSYEGYTSLVPRIVRILDRLKNKEVSNDYTYYGIPSPWLQVKCLRVLQYFPPPEDPEVLKTLTDVLKKIITGNEVVKNINKNNAQHSIVFEAVALALALESDVDLLTSSVSLLGKFITVREPNIKYLGLENMVRLAEVPAVALAIQRHQKAIVASLKDPDVSIRRRALDLLFTMCTPSNAPNIVQELVDYLDAADFSMREELVLKTAVLAERFYPSLHWYLDIMLTLIERAGEYASKDVWHSTIQLITNYPELHTYAAVKAHSALQRGASHEAIVCCAGYLLGEYGKHLSDVTPRQLFQELHERFPVLSNEGKGLLLTAYLKLLLAAPDDQALKAEVDAVYDRYGRYLDADLQQRAVEYKGLEKRVDVALRNVQAMPPWLKRRSLLLRRMAEKEGEDVEELQQKPVWLQDDEDGETDGAAAAPKLGAPAIVVSNGAQAPASNGFLGDLVSFESSSPHRDAGSEAQSAPAPAPAPVRDPLEDLLSLSTAPAPAPAPAPQAAHDPFSVSGDPHALMGGPPPPVRPIGDIGDWYRRLLTSASGVLYEDANLQVGVKSEYRGAQGQLTLFFGNKGQQALARLICVVPPAPSFTFQLGPVPPSLDAGKQVQIPLLVACQGPFLLSPPLQVSYAMGEQTMNQTLALPIVVTKFCIPPEVPVPRDAFFARWRALSGPPMKVGERVTRVTPLAKAALEQLLGGLSLGVQTDLDPDPENIVAVGTFNFVPLGQAPQQVPIMVRLEVEKVQRLQYQVTVASQDVSTTSATKDLIAQLIAKL